MGEVYRALDTRLDRDVAIKVLPSRFSENPERRTRFDREARAISRLTHPHICTLYDVGHESGLDFIVMECLEGQTLDERMQQAPVSTDQLLKIAIEVGEGLEWAHQAGIIHRDLKPANVMLTRTGSKLLDFGLARTGPDAGSDDSSASTNTVEASLTDEGAILGTLSYMAPEQLSGMKADARTDIFAFGVMLYEMATGRKPFTAPSKPSLIARILQSQPDPITEEMAPAALERVIRQCLEKQPADRWHSIHDVVQQLMWIREGSRGATPPLRHPMLPLGKAWRQTAVWGGTLAALVAGGVVASWLWHRWDSEHRELQKATSEISRLMEANEFAKAAPLIREARSTRPNDIALARWWTRATEEASVDTVPSGADVSIRPYAAEHMTWESLGKTPLEHVRVPKDKYVWRVAKQGFAPVSLISGAQINRTFKLRDERSVPEEMVVVEGRELGLAFPLGDAPAVTVDDFLIDRHEVTNAEYKGFVDGGGYQTRDFWKQPFVKDGKIVPWERAMATFVDATGRPGPATWEAGGYLHGQDKHPVAGISWYEAAAYAEFVGKSLPTVYHWTAASQSEGFTGLIAGHSNFRGTTTQPVEAPGSPSGFGTYDMAGNVKEWCWNEGRDGKRFILGGGFGEAAYMFRQADAQDAWGRRPNYGFRCAKLDSAPEPEASARIEVQARDYTNARSVSDDVFRAYRGLFAYDKTALNAHVEETETTQNWRREKVTFDAAYGNERISVHLFLPKGVSPPFQVVVYFPGIGYDERFDPSIIDDYRDYVPKGGRVLVFPIYKAFFERRDGWQVGPKPAGAYRDHVIMWSKDLGRTIDYLETRRDIDTGRMAYLGFSLGATVGPALLAVDKRLRAAILSCGGLPLRYDLPEVDRFNYAPRVHIPVLMLNGRYDDYFPVEASQLPLFRLLGTPVRDKRHVLYDAGDDLPHKEEVRESLDWLDKYLGPVKH